MGRLAFPPAAKALGRGAERSAKKTDISLTNRAGVCYCFSECTTRPALDSHGRRATGALAINTRKSDSTAPPERRKENEL